MHILISIFAIAVFFVSYCVIRVGSAAATDNSTATSEV